MVPFFITFNMKKSLFTVLVLLAFGVICMANGKRVLFIGDSITDGAWGNSKVWNTPSEERNQQDMNHIYGHGYMMICASHYQGLYPSEEFTFWNRGISGNTLADLSARWQKDALALNPDVVSILIGTNDVDKALGKGQAIDVEAWTAQYKSLLDQVLQANPSARFVLCTPFVAKAGRMADTSNYDERERMIESLQKAVRSIAQDYDAVLMPFDELVREKIEQNPSTPATYWIWDGIHPTPAMHYLMAQMWISDAYGILR